MSARSHKPDCTCTFCKNIRAKQLREQLAGTTTNATTQEKPAAAAEPIQTVKPEPEAAPPAVAASTTAKKEKKPSDFNEKLSRSWFFFLGGGFSTLSGVGIMLLGNATSNPIIITLGAVIAAGGAWMLYTGVDRFSIRAVGKKGKLKNTANSFNISEHGASFEDEASPLGMEWKWLNDGKYYHVHLKGRDGDGEIEEFELPDNNPDDQYFSPAEAINCIRMPMNEKYLNYASSNTPKFSVVVMGIIIGAEIIGLIAIG